MKVSLVRRLALSNLLLILASVCGLAQNEKPADDDKDKAEKIVQRAIQSVGGDRYLGVRTLIGRGFFTNYKDGVS